MTIGQEKDPLSWRSVPIFGLLALVLAKVQEKGLVAMVRVYKEGNDTKIETVFDSDSPDYPEIFRDAKAKKAERKR